MRRDVRASSRRESVSRPEPATFRSGRRGSSAGPRVVALVVSALLLLALTAGPLAASRAPTRSEAKAIKRAFFQRFSKASTKIRKIRVSTVNKRFSAVRYTRQIDDRPRESARAATTYTAPTPVILKKATGGKWKSVPPAKVPGKVKKDLGKKPAASNVRITGDVTATLTRGAACSEDGVSIYDPARDLYLSMQLFTSKGPGTYDAKGVGTVVGLYRNSGTELAYESGQPRDANSPSGFFHIDKGGWGIIDADLHVPPGGSGSGSVVVKGEWECR